MGVFRTRDFACLPADLAIPIDREAHNSLLRLRGGAASPTNDSVDDGVRCYNKHMAYGPYKEEYSSYRNRSHYRGPNFGSNYSDGHVSQSSRSPGPSSMHNDRYYRTNSDSRYYNKHVPRQTYTSRPPWDPKSHSTNFASGYHNEYPASSSHATDFSSRHMFHHHHTNSNSSNDQPPVQRSYSQAPTTRYSQRTSASLKFVFS